jgi:maleylacetoacetate isomerase
MEAMSEVTLYSDYYSSCAYRVRIALNLKRIPYTYHTISLKNREHKSPEYLEINPMGQVPALRIDGHTISESMVIM